MKLKARIVTFWGQRHRITPRLIEQKIGDGKQIIWFQPLSSRPSFYLLCIDSKTDIKSDKFYTEEAESVMEAIEEEYGTCDGPRGGFFDFPALNTDAGYMVGKACEEEIVEVQELLKKEVPK